MFKFTDEMKTRYILTPYYLDNPVDGLHSLAGSGWLLNEPDLFGSDQQQKMSIYHHPIANFVAEAINEGERPVSIAGDCCAMIPVLAGLQRAKLNPLLIWFDAHGDFNTWETTPSGFLGGMPLAMIVGRGDQTMAKAVGLTPFPEALVILTDARDLDPGENEAVKESAIRHLNRVEFLMEHTLLNRPLYIHFDTDILRPEDAPAMNYLAQGGPSGVELEEVFLHLASNRQIAAISMSTWNPELDQDGKSMEVCMHLLQTLVHGNNNFY